jgi:arsenite-transporting ATPase
MEHRFIFFSGKGGVGKTSMACTTGVHYADKGRKTLIVTTDPAANLSDVFEQEIGHRITKINGIDNLYAMEINSDEATKEYKERALAPMRDLFDDELIQIADEQLSGPCTEEMASFDKFIDFMGEDTYDVIIFDTAPTGHTIRLLELPVDWSKHIEESSKGSGQTCLGPVSLIQDSKNKYDEAVAKLRDKSLTKFIFVMQPEQTSLDETIRASEELKTIGISTSEIIINGLIPAEEAETPFFKSRYDMQQGYVEKAKKLLGKVDYKTMELFDKELKGIDVFRECAEKLFGISGANETINKLLYPRCGMKKNIFFSGKGGVGKTSMACITSVLTAQKGYKTLLITTDPAAHIGNVLDRPITEKITKIEGIENLYGVKIDQKKATEEYKLSVLNDARKKFDENTVEAMKEELNSPCTEEMAAFMKFIDYMYDEEFEIIVFDTAPTGHTLRLLGLPMDWNKQIEMKAGIQSEISEGDKIQKERFEKVISIMKDKDRTTFSFVMYPEKTPIAEAFRASEELKTLGIETQLVTANLIIPEDQAVSPFFRNRRNMQLKYIEEIKEAFNKCEIIKVPLFEKEIKGIDMLKDIAENLF